MSSLFKILCLVFWVTYILKFLNGEIQDDLLIKGVLYWIAAEVTAISENVRRFKMLYFDR